MMRELTINGQPGTIHLTLGGYRRLRDAHGIRLEELGRGDLYERLSGDPDLLVTILSVIGTDAESRPIGRDQWEQRLDQASNRSEAYDRALAAICEEAADFFPTAVGRLIATRRRLAAIEAADLMADPMQALGDTLQLQVATEPQEMIQQLISWAMGSVLPEQPESTPGDSPSPSSTRSPAPPGSPTRG